MLFLLRGDVDPVSCRQNKLLLLADIILEKLKFNGRCIIDHVIACVCIGKNQYISMSRTCKVTIVRKIHSEIN